MLNFLQPAHVFTLRDLNSAGSVDAFDDVPPRIGVPSFWGFVSRLPGFTDETFVEFNISSLGAASQATLSFTISNGGSNVAALPVAAYSGSGKTNTLLYGTAGSPWQTLQVAAPQPGGFCCTLSFNVTGLYNQFKNSGFTYLGFRLHDPSWSGLPSQGSCEKIENRLFPTLSARRSARSTQVERALRARFHLWIRRRDGSGLA